MHNDIEQMYIDVIEDNVNVSKTCDLKEFFILLGGLIGIVLLIVLVCDFFANIFISNMSDSAQMKIERLFSDNGKDSIPDKKYEKPFKILKINKELIISKDADLQNKSSFPIVIKDEKFINAWITPCGTIYFTTALLNENFSNEELAFVLAHELGHYKHRDHLKSISRQLTIAMICNLFFGKASKTLQKIVGNITNLEALNHSRNQERNADSYASEMLIKIYGNNNGGIKFLQHINKKERMLELSEYFSTHPSTSKRIKLLQK